MIILGIDPGSLRCGYALLEDLGGRVPYVRETGVWVLGDGKLLPERLARLQGCLDELLDRGKPDLLSMEQTFVHKNVASTLVLCHARGVVMGRCAARGMPVHEYAPSSVKQAIAGSGRASKEAVADMVRRQLSLQELPDSADATDALAIAYTHHVLSKDPLVRAKATSGNAGRRGFDVDAYLERVRAERKR